MIYLVDVFISEGPPIKEVLRAWVQVKNQFFLFFLHHQVKHLKMKYLDNFHEKQTKQTLQNADFVFSSSQTPSRTCDHENS